MAHFLLIHSPLVGPSSWTGVAGVLEDRGHRCAVPDLREATRSGSPVWKPQVEAAREAAAEAGLHRPVVAAHSGGGAVLPAVADAVSPVAAHLFVDAVLPRRGAGHVASVHPSLRARLESLAGDDGLLPPWHRWWGLADLAPLLPDPEARARFEAELEPLPVTILDEDVPVPAGWPAAPTAYLRLSEHYELEEADAARNGWLVTHLDGTHLDVVSRPDTVAAAMLTLLERLGVLDTR